MRAFERRRGEPAPQSCLSGSDLLALAAATAASASTTAARLWCAIEPLEPAGVYIDSPSAFSRNRLGHGRLCEKCSLIGVSFQSTPSVACGIDHGADWAWLAYGMVAFAACLRRGALTATGWEALLASGMFPDWQSCEFVVRECFPTATISRLRARGRTDAVTDLLAPHSKSLEVQAVERYLKDGVNAVKRAGDSLYDRADALVAALGALPHVRPDFQEVVLWPSPGCRWSGEPGTEHIEGTFVCVE